MAWGEGAFVQTRGAECNRGNPRAAPPKSRCRAGRQGPQVCLFPPSLSCDKHRVNRRAEVHFSARPPPLLGEDVLRKGSQGQNCLGPGHTATLSHLSCQYPSRSCPCGTPGGGCVPNYRRLSHTPTLILIFSEMAHLRPSGCKVSVQQPKNVGFQSGLRTRF